jgi:hypothetical protein
MTIAVCCASLEGTVLGADSTASFAGPNGFHYLNFNQKLFELGEGSTLGVLTWGLGSLPTKSYRTLFAALADDLQGKPAVTVEDVANRWADMFWPEYNTGMKTYIQRCRDLAAKTPRDPKEEEDFKTLKRGLVAGFCIGGYAPPDRAAGAYEVLFDPLLTAKPVPQKQTTFLKFWGAPNPILRLINGADEDLKQEIVNSGKWSGTPVELDALCAKQALRIPMLPIRDAVDLVHACISSTIKAMKFSDLPQICGGPIEIAVITSDRRFRWVKHKTWDAAIMEG